MELEKHQKKSFQLDVNSNHVASRCFEAASPPNKRLPDYNEDDDEEDPEGGSFVCGSCGCKFVRDYQLWWHRRDHIPRDERHLCHLCPFVSQEANSLRLHVRRCHQTMNGGVACNVCQGAFVARDRDHLSRHIYRSHMFDKRFHFQRPPLALQRPFPASWQMTSMGSSSKAKTSADVAKTAIFPRC